MTDAASDSNYRGDSRESSLQRRRCLATQTALLSEVYRVKILRIGGRYQLRRGRVNACGRLEQGDRGERAAAVVAVVGNWILGSLGVRCGG